MSTLSTDHNNSSPRRWSILRKFLIVLAGLATLVAILYTEENWRGKRAWEQCKRELAAQGEVMDWSALIPPPVPDDQNFFKAPNMQEYFVGRGGSNRLAQRLSAQLQIHDLPVVTVAVLSTSTNIEKIPCFDLSSSEDCKKLQSALLAAVGPSIHGPVGHTFLADSAAQVKPVDFAIRYTNKIDSAQLARLFPMLIGSTIADRFMIDSTVSNRFGLTIHACPAADYLAANDAQADFDAIREALKRPYTRMEGNYEDPFETLPIPNFVTVRSVVQTLANRAQCYLLLGKPEQALRELSLMNDLCAILESRPTGHPMTLVAAMINVAVRGLQAGVISDGMRRNAWRDEDLAAIQKQLSKVDLPPFVAHAFVGERAGVSRTLEVMSLRDMYKILSVPISERVNWAIIPRGWIDLNLATHAQLIQQTLGAFDLQNHVIQPTRVNAVMNRIEENQKSITPDMVVQLFFPNTSKAISACAFNQTQVDEAIVACALERYRIAHKEYPEKLDALAPEFIAQLPHDIIGGKPLHYCRTVGGFQLYSIGWNETDDGGAVDVEKERGDWVWGELRF